jgi:Aldehyde dehydrogenase family/Carbohydrate-selective porin, OprB family
MGPLVSEEQLNRVLGFLESGKADGVKTVVGGNRVGEQGYFVEPTILTGARPGMKVVDEEIFGPVVCAMPFDEIDQVAAQMNQTSYGLAGAIWTKDIGKAHRMARAMRAGTVWINCYNIFDAALPFGGYKQSGWGREMGKEAIELYTEVQVGLLESVVSSRSSSRSAHADRPASSKPDRAQRDFTIEFFIPHLFVRQVFGFGGEQEHLDEGPLQLAENVDISRLTITAGKMAVGDQFDNNAYAHDPSSQFLNWALVDAGAFDYAADSLGYEYGITAELNQKAWAARVGYFTVPRVNNGLATDGHYFKAFQLVGEAPERCFRFCLWSCRHRSGASGLP